MSEDKLRRLLQGLAGGQPAGGDRWAALVARRRRRQAWQAGAVGTTGLAVVLAGVLALQGGGTTQTLISTDPTDTPSPVETTVVPTPTASSTSAATTATPVAPPTPAPTSTPTSLTGVPPVGVPAGPVRLAAVGSWSYPAPQSLIGSSPRTDVPQLLRSWAASVNERGGIAGRRVELTVMDAQGSKALHQDVEQLVAQGVDAFVHTDVDDYVESYLRGKRIPVLGGDLGSSLWSSSPVLFAQGTDGTAVADGLAVLAAREVPHGHLGVVCTDLDCAAPARLIEDRRAALYGLDPTYLERQPTSSTDYTGAAIRMQRAGVDVVAIALPPQQAAGFARNAAGIGWNPKYVLTSALATNESALSEPLLRGALTPQQVLPWPAAPTAYRAVVPSGAKQGAVLTSAWASTQLAEAVVGRAGPLGGDLLVAADQLSGSTAGGAVPPLALHRVQRCFYVGQVGTGTWHAPDGLETSCGKP